MRSFSLFAAFIGGAALGAAAGILFAPESGRETRRKLVEQSNRMADRVKEALAERGISISKQDLETISEELREELV
ncbi:MAG: YtxH domain-containing protein [Bacteroidaceae bacterium]|nr:YtxH domain-containing protein [Bacteroidaceae bacterium]